MGAGSQRGKEQKLIIAVLLSVWNDTAECSEITLSWED